MRKYIFTTKLVAILAVLLVLLVPTGNVFAQNTSPLCFTARNGSVDVRFSIKYGMHTIQYSTNNISWFTYTSNTTVTINANQSIFFRAAVNQTNATAFGNISLYTTQYSRFYFSSSNGGTIEASGNIMSLYGPDCPNLPLQQYAFIYMFSGCHNLTTAPELPATTLADDCYKNMFSGCTSLTTAPALPANTLADNCYGNMFTGCTSLITTPALPATILANNCYQYMFYGCTSLTTVTSLPATTLADECYYRMFEGCTSLTTVCVLPATTLAKRCYYQMFYGCSSLITAPSMAANNLVDGCCSSMFSCCTALTAAPALPATTLAKRCYFKMFYSCTSLTTAPSLPATILADSCYYDMFNGCSSLATPPTLSSTNLADYCYLGMFYGCSSLTNPPALPATNLADYCYLNMFRGCTSLTTAPALPATTLANYCYQNMFAGCTTLTDAPALPATIIANHCYGGMFEGCTSLTTPPALPATVLADHCYQGMFFDCTSLTTPPALPADTLAYECYRSMFYGCTSLTSTPTLPATVLEEGCYSLMFKGCTSLVKAPKLPATTLAPYCYQYMFWECSSLVINLTGPGKTWIIQAPSSPSYALSDMLSATGGTMSGTPSINTTYYVTSGVHILTVNANNTTMGSVSGGGYYNGGDTTTLTAIPNQHYHFVNWSNGDTTSTINIVITKDSTLTANFAIDQHIVGTNVNDTIMGTVSGAGTYNYGSTATLTATANANYHFVNWSNGATTAKLYLVVTKDSMLTANFAINEYIVTASPNDTAMGSVTGSGTYDYGTNITLTATANAHYHFENWSNGATSETIHIVVSKDSTLTANFAIDENNVIAFSNDSNMGNVVGSGNYGYGTTATLIAIPNEGYHFVSWSNGTTATTVYIVVTADTILTANFDINQYVVTASSNDTSMGSVFGAGTYNYGTTITVTATPNEHYHFVNWSNGETSATINVSVICDSTLTAYFKIDKHTITALSNKDNYGAVTGGGVFDYGTTVTLTTTPNEHYVFTGWDNGATNPALTIVVDKDSTVEAIFVPIQYNVVATANYGNRGVATGSGSYDYGTTATLTATPNEGFVFRAWSNGATSNTIFIQVESDTALTAMFDPIPSSVDDVEGKEYIVYSNGNNIHINGAAGEAIRIYDINGKLISEVEETSDEQIVLVYVAGVYFVRINEKKSIKVVVK